MLQPIPTQPSIPYSPVTERLRSIFEVVANNDALVNPNEAKVSQVVQLVNQVSTQLSSTLSAEDMIYYQQILRGQPRVTFRTTNSGFPHPSTVGTMTPEQIGIQGTMTLLNMHTNAHLSNLSVTLSQTSSFSALVQNLLQRPNPCDVFKQTYGTLTEQDALDALISILLAVLAGTPIGQVIGEILERIAEITGKILNELNVLNNTLRTLRNYGDSSHLDNLNPCENPLMQKIASQALVVALNVVDENRNLKTWDAESYEDIKWNTPRQGEREEIIWNSPRQV